MAQDLEQGIEIIKSQHSDPRIIAAADGIKEAFFVVHNSEITAEEKMKQFYVIMRYIYYALHLPALPEKTENGGMIMAATSPDGPTIFDQWALMIKDSQNKPKKWDPDVVSEKINELYKKLTISEPLKFIPCPTAPSPHKKFNHTTYTELRVFSIGDVVRCAGDNVDMTIKRLLGDKALCTWFNGIYLREKWFACDDVEKVSTTVLAFLPKEANPTNIDAKVQYSKMGIEITKEDDILFHVELPALWRVTPYNHYWANLYDEKMRKRAYFFIKDTPHERYAFINFSSRYTLRNEYVQEKDRMGLRKFYVTAVDQERVLYKGSLSDFDTPNDGITKCQEFLDANFPHWKDINAYWD